MEIEKEKIAKKMIEVLEQRKNKPESNQECREKAIESLGQYLEKYGLENLSQIKTVLSQKYYYNDDTLETILEDLIGIHNQLENSKDRYVKYNSKEIINKEKDILDNKIILPIGTLIHGTGDFELTENDIGKFRKICNSYKKYGIISSDINKERLNQELIYNLSSNETEYGETHFCADFYKISDKLNLIENLNRIKNSDFMGRMPFKKIRESIAFIIEPKEEIKELLETDMYLAQNIENKMQRYLNLNEQGKQEGYVSAIPLGLPSESIDGIMVSKLILSNRNYMNELKRIFPKCYLCDSELNLYFSPQLNDIENEKNENRILNYLNTKEYLDSVVGEKFKKNLKIKDTDNFMII